MEILVKNLKKSFEEECVIDDWSFSFETGKRYALMGASGIGKTTFLRILMGLERAEAGEVIFPWASVDFSCVFQESRLCENFSAMGNLLAVKKRLYDPTEAYIRGELEQLLLPEEAAKKVCHMSGGMRRRVEIVRAMAVKSQIVLLDEPFTGLDEKNKKRAAEYILERQRERTLVMVTHDEMEAQLLDCCILWLTKR